MAMIIPEKTMTLLRQTLRCVIYIGIGHTAFEVVSILRSPEIADLRYFGLAVPGLYYLIPSIVLALFIGFCKTK